MARGTRTGFLPSFVVATILLTPLAAFGEKTDIVVMLNGDRLTCEVKRLDRGRLDVKTDHLAKVSIEWEHVESVETNRVFEVELVDGTTHYGSLAAGGEARILIVNEETGPKPIALERVVFLTKIGSNFVSRLEGSVDLGFNVAKANREIRYSLAGDVQHRGRASETTFSLSSLVSKRSDTTSTDRHVVEIGHSRYRSLKQWDLVGSAKAERNSQLDLDLRSLVTVALKRRLVHTNDNRVRLALGASYNNERYGGSPETQNSAEALVGFSYEYFRFSPLLYDFTVGLDLFPSISESGRYRFEGEARYRHEIISNLVISFRGWYSYDSKPPSGLATGEDWGLDTALGWTF